MRGRTENPVITAIAQALKINRKMAAQFPREQFLAMTPEARRVLANMKQQGTRQKKTRKETK